VIGLEGGFQIHQAGKFNEKHPWFYAPNLKEFEVEKKEKDILILKLIPGMLNSMGYLKIKYNRVSIKA